MNPFSVILLLVTLSVGGGAFYQGVNSENKDTFSGAISYPISRGEERERKLTFGLFVTPDPKTNPINPPERFTGYHTALDFEIFPEEETVDVPVTAACAGEVLHAKAITGYGGVIVQSCFLNSEDVTVLYGHLDYSRFQKNVGQKIEEGDQVGFLGDEKSPESGNTRKHLHFGIHRGKDVEVRGYVEKETELESFIDPFSLLQK